MVISGANIMLPSSEKLMEWGANTRTLTIGKSEWWRLFTCIFAHVGIIHIALNMYALLYIGAYLEPLLGKVRYLACYIATGLMASLASIWWHDNAASAGASGAIFGLYGIFFALLTTDVIEKSARSSLIKSIGLFIAYNLVFGLVGPIDNAAHIGGLLSGMLFGYIIYVTMRARQLRNGWAGAVFIVALSITAIAFTLPAINDPIGAYVRTMENYSKYEAEALKFYNMPPGSSDNARLIALRDQTIPNWQKCKAELSKLDNEKLPVDLKTGKDLIAQYVDYRIRESQLMLAKMTENSNKYDSEITELTRKVDSVFSKLKELSK
jgi:rhomboid protease GluP